MQDKKVIILIVLSIFAIASLIYGVTSHPKGRAKKAHTYTAEDASPQQASSQAVVSTQRRAKRSKLISWKRNPFVPTDVPGTPSSLVLNGIVSQGKDLKALVGDAMVGKGDKVGNNTVVDIKKDRVILNDGTKDFELTLKQ